MRGSEPASRPRFTRGVGRKLVAICRQADVADDNPSASGDNWALQVAVAEVAMRCTVTPTGTVLKLKPL
jgi:hypothetical protein